MLPGDHRAGSRAQLFGDVPGSAIVTSRRHSPLIHATAGAPPTVVAVLIPISQSGAIRQKGATLLSRHTPQGQASTREFGSSSSHRKIKHKICRQIPSHMRHHRSMLCGQTVMIRDLPGAGPHKECSVCAESEDIQQSASLMAMCIFANTS